MTQTPAGPGWYDDPDDPALLRYFDGVIWTAHTTQRHSPTADASTIGRAPDVPAADARVGWPQQTPTQPGPDKWPGQGQLPGQAGGQRPGAGPGGTYGPAWGQRPDVLPDGAVLAEWWRRLVARLLDTLFAGVVTLVVAIPWFGDALGVMSEFLDEAAATGGSVDTTRFVDELTAALLPVSLVSLVVTLVYEVLFLTWRSATPGKMILGTVVRRTGGAGPIGLATAVRRQLISVATALSAFVPILNAIGSMLQIIDPAWLLWDRRRQALHDKVADTVVVLRDSSP